MGRNEADGGRLEHERVQGRLDIMSSSLKALECARPRWLRIGWAWEAGGKGSKCAWQPEGGARRAGRGAHGRCAKPIEGAGAGWKRQGGAGHFEKLLRSTTPAGSKALRTTHHTTHTHGATTTWLLGQATFRSLAGYFNLRVRLLPPLGSASRPFSLHTPHLCIPSSPHTNTGRSTTFTTLLNTATTHFGTVSLILFSF